MVHAPRGVGRRVRRAHTDRDEIERHVVLADREVEGGEQGIPSLAALAPAREQHERTLEPVAGAKALGVVLLGHVHPRTGDVVRREHRAPMGQLVLGLGEEPQARDVREDRLQHVERRVRLVVQARHDDRALGRDRRARDRRPEQVRRQDHRVVPLGVQNEMVEQLRDPEQAVDPRELIGVGDHLARLDAGLDTVAGAVRRRALDREAVHRDAGVAVGLRPRRILVAPRVVIARTGREHFDVVPASREALRGLAHHGFRTADDLGPVPRRHEGEPAARRVRHRWTIPS